MKLKEVPQDKTPLENFTKEILYAKNDNNEYQSTLSSGWDIKTEALNEAWSDIEEDINKAKELLENGIKSPIYYLMVKNLMTLSILSGYTGFWKITIKKHFNPKVYKKLSKIRLEKYAFAFKIPIEELIEFQNTKKEKN
ncbi:MAG: hypothetical protein HYU67_03515 [Flavobacteriia bacterium]|nr:hypothetical protein [Flavobacteriia bacterium]